MEKVGKAEREARAIKFYFEKVNQLFMQLKAELARIEHEEADYDIDMGYDFVPPRR